jgi:hypothetical protein
MKSPNGLTDVAVTDQSRIETRMAEKMAGIEPEHRVWIGARGSGKTALMDLLAAGVGAFSTPSASSFRQRASKPLNLLGATEVELRWATTQVRRRS